MKGFYGKTCEFAIGRNADIQPSARFGPVASPVLPSGNFVSFVGTSSLQHLKI
jgi:hypothetical protein